MCENKTILVSVCLMLLVTASFCKYRVQPEKEVGQHSEIKVKSHCENEYKDYCLNGKFHYLLEEDVLGCNCSWSYGGKRCKKYMWWT